jgi:hypothetical protein
MAIQSKPFYWVTCDTDDCKATAPSDDGDASAWSDESSALDDAASSEWLIDGDRHFCRDHSACCDRCGDIVKVGTLDDDDRCPKCQAAPDGE